MLKVFGFSSNAAAASAASNLARAQRSKAVATSEPTGPVAWELMRAPGRQQDHMLLDVTVAWARQLPRELEPFELMERYPRVANRLALCWSDAVLTARLLDTLLMDRRGGRKGFPPNVAVELVRMRRLYKAPAADAITSEPWSLQATSDR